MEEIVAYCGITCTECPAYIATRDDDDELRRKTADQWGKEFSADLSPDDINCSGCSAPEGVYFGHCHECYMRNCAIEKKLSTCADCADYACDRLKEFFGFVPAAKEKLDSLRQGG